MQVGQDCVGPIGHRVGPLVRLKAQPPLAGFLHSGGPHYGTFMRNPIRSFGNLFPKGTPMPPKRYPKNVPGDFYVEDECCVRCGVPMTEASDLIRFDEENREYPHCYVYRQPKNPDEINRMLNVHSIQEFGCFRYSGTNREVLESFAAMGASADCDFPIVSDPGGVQEKTPTTGIKGGICCRLWECVRRWWKWGG